MYYFSPGSITKRVDKSIKWFIAILLISGISLPVIGVDRVSSVIEKLGTSQLAYGGWLSPPVRGEPDFRRAQMYYEGINAIREAPLLGIGFHGLKPFVEERDRYGGGVISHNLVITAWGELGVLGISVCVWLFWSNIAGLMRLVKNRYLDHNRRQLVAATLVALLLLLVQAQFRPFFSNPLAPILFAQSYSIIRSARESRRRRQR